MAPSTAIEASLPTVGGVEVGDRMLTLAPIIVITMP
jgi:hypothetical protein